MSVGLGCRAVGASLLIAASMGCPSTTSTLTVRVQSGLRAGPEVRFVGVSLFRGAVPCSSTASTLADDGLALVASDQSALGLGILTVAELGGLAAGTYTVRVHARRPGAGSASSGPVLIERCVLTSISSDRVIRVALTTDCIGVTCPATGGSPAFDQCLNGRCVDPRCDPGDPSTTELCCDRAVLGDACDTDPTLCTDSASCSGGPPTCHDERACAEGVCVEPAEDSCPEGQYCDSVANACVPDPSGGPSDAGGMEQDASALPDASVSLDAADSSGPDAASDDAPATTADAGTDAASILGEDCTLAGDEDLDRLLDCADPECAPTVMCTAGCTVLPSPPRTPTAAISPPTHWYRIPESVVSNTRGEVCALRDLAGSAHFMAIDRTITGIRSYASTRQGLAIDPGQRLASPSNLGLGPTGGYSAFVVLGPDDPETLTADFTILRTWAPASSAKHFSWQVSYASGPRYFTLGLQEGLFDVGFTASYPYNMEGVLVQPIAAGDDLAGRVRYYQGVDSAREPRLTGGSGIAGAPTGPEPTRAELGPSDSAGVRLEEIVLYDRVVSAAELAQVRTYLAR